MERLEAILALGRIAHETVLAGLDVRNSAAPFGHGRRHRIGAIDLYDSFHCSRLNTNTGKLTKEMFRKIFERAKALVGDGNNRVIG